MPKRFLKKINSEKGDISLLLAILLLSALLVIGLGVSALILSQIKMSGQSAESVVAFYAAESGAERCLYEVRKNGALTCPFTNIQLDTISPFDNAFYTTSYNGLNQIVSKGKYLNASRKVKLNWEE